MEASYPSRQQAIVDMVEAGRRMYQHRLIVALLGNLSARVGPDEVLTTPAGVCKGFLSAGDLLAVDLEGRAKKDGHPSSELAMHLAERGAKKVEPMNTGGTVNSADFDLTMVHALHSSSSNRIYLGNPCGIILRAKGGNTLYHMGDTEVFGDMALINSLYAPDIGIVPIGDRFTMGARSAAHACKTFFDFRTVFPAHYGTFLHTQQQADTAFIR